ncbi:MAG TPA: DUF4442 domain-containing protein [Terriglobales bacterium]|nr:DUF4442 domain-containing protein [Terriglobales bacterium]
MKNTIIHKLRCWFFYWYGCYRGTGGRVSYVASDWREIRVDVPLSWRTRNYVGTIFGGSMYGAVDPIYMLMLIKVLGPEYVVWDKAATIQFKKPGRSALQARFVITEDEVSIIRATLEKERSVGRTYCVDLVDQAGEVCASVEKLVYIRKRTANSSR